MSSRDTTLMIVAAGPLQVPAFEEARALGCRIVAIDGNASAVGMSMADRAWQIDIKQSERILDIARSEHVAGVTSICTDFAVRTLADVAAGLGLPGLQPDAALRATDKRLMRRAFAASGVPSPAFAEASDLRSALDRSRELGLPVALKIPRSAGSRGVYRVDTPAQMVAHYEQARRLEPTEDLLVEQWLTGPEVSVEGCCVGRSAHIVQITDKIVFAGPSPVEAGHTQPSRLPQRTQQAIRQVTVAAIAALGLEDCGFHAELKITGQGPLVIEVAARLGGDRISTQLTPLSTGINLVRAVIDLALGRAPALEARHRRGAAIRYFQAPAAGLLESVAGMENLCDSPHLESLQSVTEWGEPLKPGLRLRPVQSSLDRCGYVVFSGADADDAAARADAAIRSVVFNVRPEAPAAGPRACAQVA